MIELIKSSTSSSIPMTFTEWTGRRSIETLGTTAGLAPLAFQRWRNFKEAYAPELIERAVSETPGRILHIADPFGGSGTTGLAAQFLGARPTLVEVNPYLADLIQAKLETYDPDLVAQRLSEVFVHAKKGQPRGNSETLFPNCPPTFIEPGVKGQFIFSRAVARRIQDYVSAINCVPEEKIRRLFKVLLGSILISVSNVSISGKGRRYRRGWKGNAVPVERVDHAFQEHALNAIFDIQMYRSRAVREFTLLRGDSRSLVGGIERIDLSVFSPPYPNSFDYTDVYNVELWMLGYLHDSASNHVLRNATLRSHVQISRDMGGSGFSSKSLKATVKALDQKRNVLWNQQIPQMIAAYVSDMGDIMTGIARGLRAHGRLYMVVGDSRYADVYVPVAKMLTEISTQTGLHLVASEACRSMRSSPQQGGREELKETLLILEKRS